VCGARNGLAALETQLLDKVAFPILAIDINEKFSPSVYIKAARASIFLTGPRVAARKINTRLEFTHAGRIAASIDKLPLIIHTKSHGTSHTRLITKAAALRLCPAISLMWR
jgi:hypothetical protein